MLGPDRPHNFFMGQSEAVSEMYAPRSRGRNYKSSTVGSLIQAFLFSPPTAIEHTTN